MGIKLNITTEDSPGFTRVVDSILDSVIVEHTPQVVAVIQINNWFDHKWLNFSGKVLGALGIWKSDLTFPPFNPNRVKSQTVYQLDNDEYRLVEAPSLHVAQQSSENLNRKLKHAIDSGIFVWWSSKTITNDKGSIMVYMQNGDESSAWFVSLEQRKSDWKICRTEGIPVETVKRFMREVEPNATYRKR